MPHFPLRHVPLPAALAAAALILALSPALAAQAPSLSPAESIAVPGMQGGFNHMTFDAARLRLYATAPANKTLEVIDLSTGRPLRSIPGEKPAAALYAPEFDQLYVARGQSVVIYNGATLDPVATIDVKSNLDELHYDPRAKELYAGCMSDGTTGIAVIGIPQGKLLAIIPLPSKPQGFAVEMHGTRIFANTPVQQQIAVVDRSTRTVLPPIQLHDAQGNTPIALDEAHHRLLVGVRRPAQLLAIDTVTGKQVAQVDIHNDTDDLFYDPQASRIYISCGEGFVDVVQQLTPDRYQRVAQLPTPPGSRTSTFSPSLQRLFVGSPPDEKSPAQIHIFRTTK